MLIPTRWGLTPAAWATQEIPTRSFLSCGPTRTALCTDEEEEEEEEEEGEEEAPPPARCAPSPPTRRRRCRES